MISAAIQWRWPGAACVTRGEALERWDGPMPRPTEAEIAQAVAEYEPWYRWHVVRLKRNALLAACDWTQIADAVIAAEDVAAWVSYRRALRQIPQTQTNPSAIAWPTPPFALDPPPP